MPFDAYKRAEPYIFTSYAHKNMKDVFRIIKRLNNSRCRIWYDEGMKLQRGKVQFLNRFEITEREFLEKLKKVLRSDLRG